MTTKEKAIIIDIDGTLADCEHRRHHVENKDWNSFYAAMADDKPNKWCWELAFGMENRGYVILLVSGRPAEWRDTTLKWLENSGINFNFPEDTILFMRKSGDFRKDSIIKEEIFRFEIEPHFDVLFCVDDRKQVVDMWRSIGLTCLQCSEGDF